MEVIYYGHACVGIRIGDTHLLIDPFISENPSASHINVNDVPADYMPKLSLITRFLTIISI